MTAIAADIGAQLTRLGLSLATAESCTAGMLGEVITSVGGSSEYYLGGIIAYHNDVKVRFLGVSEDLLQREGAVSESVARQMALGVIAALSSDCGIGITGVAGPGGGTPAKPVGLVYIAVASPFGIDVTGYNFRGGRQDVRRAAVITSLHMLQNNLLAGHSPQ